MENTNEIKEKTRYTNIKLDEEIYKALQYAKIETGDNIECLTQKALKSYLISLGFLKENGEANRPSPIVLDNTEKIIEA